MCTVIVLVRPGHPWPLLLAANRDEAVSRPWDRPGAHWPARPGLVAGRDRLAGGTWLAVEHGRVATVLNRPGSLGPAIGKRSRGELPLRALAGEPIDAGQYRPFNLVTADRHGARFMRGDGHGRAAAWALPPGLSVVTAHDPNDVRSPRAAAALPRFESAAAPDPDSGEWSAWQALLADRGGAAGSALNVTEAGGFGTVCSTLIALPAQGAPVWLFAAGPPDRTPFRPVTLPAGYSTIR